MPQYIKECREAEEQTGVKVLVGIESNIRGVSGLCDLRPSEYEMFDIYLCGVHVCLWYETMRDWFHLCAGNYLKTILHIKPSKTLIRETTKAYIKSIEKNPIDILTHINYMCFCDPVEVAKACRDNGTYLEISAKKPHLQDEYWEGVINTGVRSVINSDAHSIERIGDTRIAEEQIARVGIPLDRIDNIDGRLPNFRFAEYKKRNL
jgi:putative hydrolase